MIFWLSCIDRTILDCFYIVFPAIIASVKLYLFDLFIHPLFSGGALF